MAIGVQRIGINACHTTFHPGSQRHVIIDPQHFITEGRQVRVIDHLDLVGGYPYAG